MRATIAALSCVLAMTGVAAIAQPAPAAPSAGAATLTEGGNVILLDEPTNDLDIETLQNLEEALEEFAGCAVVISHDRWFLDRLATHILAFEGDSHVEWFEGNFEAYEEDKKRRLGADSLIPSRIKFQKFGR